MDLLNVSITTGKQKNNSLDWTLFLLLFLGALNTLSHGTYFFIVAAGLLVICHKLVFPKSFTPIFLFAVFYSIFVVFNEYLGLKHSIKIWAVPLIWLAGYYWRKSNSIHGIVQVLLLLTISMSIHGVLNFFLNTSQGVDFSHSGGAILDVWENDTKTAATGQALNFAFLVSIFFWVIFFQKNSVLKIITLVLYGLAFIYCILIGSRSFFALSLIAVLLTPIISLFLSHDIKAIKRILWILLILLLVFLLTSILYANNIFGLQDLFEDSYLYHRFFRTNQDKENLTETGRWELKLHYISLMPKHLWGGGHIHNDYFIEGGYAHELWLDIYDEAGIVPYLFILSYTICSMIRFLKLAKRRDIDNNIRAMFLVFFVIMMAQFFIEPILNGQTYLFYSFLLIDGMLTKFLLKRKNKQ